MTDIEDMSVSELEGRALDYLETLTQEERERFATFLRKGRETSSPARSQDMNDTTYDSIDAIDIRTAASRIGVSSRTMHRLVTTGELRSIKLGRRRLVRVNALRDYLDTLETSSADAS